jgi:hypothetical protein
MADEPKAQVTIEKMFKVGTRYKVSLSCGHSFTLSPGEVKEQQLFIGKQIVCRWCVSAGR